MRSSELEQVLSHVDDGEVWASSSGTRTAIFVGSTIVARVRTGPDPEGMLKVGNLSIDTSTRIVRVNNEKVSIRPIAYKILLILVEHDGRVVERSFFHLSIWEGYDADHALDVHISTIRGVLDRAGCDQQIVIVTNVGFRIDPKE